MVLLGIAALVVSVVAVVWARSSAQSAERSADEAAKTRSDALGPDVTVGTERALRERWNVLPFGLPNSHLGYPPGVAAPERQFIRPADLDVRVLVGAHLTMVNEGARTVTVKIGAFRVDRCDDFEQREEVLAPPAERPSPALDGGRLVLEPRQRAGVIVRVGPTVSEWIANHDRPYVAEIEAQTSPDGAVQHWSLELSAEVLWPVHGNDAAFRVVPHRPPELRLVELPRTYPLRPRHRRRWPVATQKP